MVAREPELDHPGRAREGMRKSLLAATVGILLPLVLVAMGPSDAGVFYLPEKSAIWVTDYPEAWPCTMARLLALDQMNGWGRIAYDQEADAYTIDCHLWIGANDGSNTYLQLGSKQHPGETLILRGNLVVYPYYIQGENPGKDPRDAPHEVNRLTIGVEDDPSISAALKIDSRPDARHTIYVGRLPNEQRLQHGGQFHVYHGTVTANIQDRDHAVGTGKQRVILTGDSIVLKHATYSWMGGVAAYGMYAGNAVVEDSLFDNCGTVIYNGLQDLKRCIFRNCQRAVNDAGALDAVLTECVFEQNEQNWYLAHSKQGLVAIDCTYDQPRKGNWYRSWVNPQTGKAQYPSFTSRRHIIVEVVDEGGKPVPKAVVETTCQQGDWGAVDNRKAATDIEGKTPGKGDKGAILLTEVIEKATDQPGQPEVKEYSYQIKVSAPGLKGVSIKNFRPKESWKVLRVILAK